MISQRLICLELPKAPSDFQIRNWADARAARALTLARRADGDRRYDLQPRRWRLIRVQEDDRGGGARRLELGGGRDARLGRYHQVGRRANQNIAMIRDCDKVPPTEGGDAVRA